MNNLELYEKFRQVPDEAKKKIQGGRLKGMTDINPMWRIKKLTEVLGPCGIGWKYTIKDKRLENGASGEIAAFVEIELYIKYNNEWSEAIPGLGGSSFVRNEKTEAYTSDECFKMALTDAISVSCKALGIGADVYFDKDTTKYDNEQDRSLSTMINIDDKRVAVFNYLNTDIQFLQNTLKHYNIGEMEDLNNEQIKVVYYNLKKRKLI
ncbi:MAG: hypothetical protein PUB21_11855 [Bacteroidales bacterium]|nr:hypothetical protein [Bacteroidales bacterium]